jgi:FkbM family methyltransferase
MQKFGDRRTATGRLLLLMREHGDKWNERTGADKLVRAGLWTLWQLLATWSHPLARGERRRAVADLVRSRRRRNQEDWVRVHLAVGAVVTGPADVTGQYTSLGLYEYEEQAFVADVIRAGDVAVDVGAFAGSYTIPLAACGATVHAFEPASAARAHLERNVAGNDFSDRVHVYPWALGASSRQARMTTSYASGNRIVDAETDDAGTTTVEVVSLDSWSEDLDLEGLLLIKIDAEGTDERVLAGAHALLRRHDPALIVEYWDGGASLRGALAELGLRCFRYDPVRRALVPLEGAIGSGNVIACSERRAQLLAERLSDAHPREHVRPAVEWLTAAPH